MAGTQNRHHLSVQEGLNLSWDNTYDVLAASLVGYDSGAGVLRRFAVDASGNLKIDPTNLNSAYLKLDQTTAQTITGSPILNSLTALKLLATDSNKKLTNDTSSILPQFMGVNLTPILNNTIKVLAPSSSGDGYDLTITAGEPFGLGPYSGGDLILKGAEGFIGGNIYVTGARTGSPYGKTFIGSDNLGNYTDVYVYANTGALTGLLKATSGLIGTASSGIDYAPATSGTAILKGNGSGGFSAASAGTDYAGLAFANVFTTNQKINVNSTTAFFVEQDGVKDNVFVVDTTNGRVGINTTPSYPFHVVCNNANNIPLFYSNSDTRATGYFQVGNDLSIIASGSTVYYVGNTNSFTVISNSVPIFRVSNYGSSFSYVNPPNNFGIGTTAADRKLEVNDASGNCLRLTYNDSNGSAANYADFLVSSAGNLTVTAVGSTTITNDFLVNGNTTLGNANTDLITATARLVLRTLGADPKGGTPPAGSAGEIGYYSGKIYVCTAATPTWELITSA